MTPLHYIDALRARYGWSDYECSKAIGITRAQVSRIRNHDAAVSDETALRLAELTGADEGTVLAELAAHRAKSPAVKKVWQRLASPALALMTVGVAAQLVDLQAHAAELDGQTSYVLCAMIAGFAFALHFCYRHAAETHHAKARILHA